MVTICLQCGDRGFSNAFVYCVKCLNFAVHRYCLDELPKLFDEFVYWVCDDCEVEMPRKLATVKSKTTKSEGRDHTSLKNVEEQKTGFTSKGGKRKRPRLQCRFRKRKMSLFSQEPPKPKLETRCSKLPEVAELPISSLLSTKLKRKQSSFLKAKVEDNKLRPAETETDLELTRASPRAHDLSYPAKSKVEQNKANFSAANSPEQGAKNGLNVSQQASTYLESLQTKANFSADNSPKKAAKNGLEVSQQALTYLENSSSFVYVEPAKPLVEPIWRGGFFILNKDYDAVDGLVAHLSNKACWKVCEEARLFPSLLDLQMYPKADVWPKSFQKSEPSDDNIALYFFALGNRYEKLFDDLVTDMMREELALKATVENADLLIFTSNELPRNYWQFQGKYYLWGVFIAKHASSA